LADAQARWRPDDQILDSAIGLEAILLAGQDDGKCRGELRYRFSINYSALSDTPEARHRDFHIARDLYDLRSKIAHGDLPDGRSWKVGGRKLSLDEAAKIARDSLRRVIGHFLRQPSLPAFRRSHYWERAYFGLPASDDTN
jgi:hypothetical protein